MTPLAVNSPAVVTTDRWGQCKKNRKNASILNICSIFTKNTHRDDTRI